jgi:hypothetical protein
MEELTLEQFKETLLNPTKDSVYVQEEFLKPPRALCIPVVEFPKIPTEDVLLKLENIRKYMAGLNSGLNPLEVQRKECTIPLIELVNHFQFAIASYEVLILSLCKHYDSFDIYDSSIEKLRVVKMVQMAKYNLIQLRLRASRYEG